MAKQQRHPIADQFSDEELEAIRRYGQALGGSTKFSDEVEEHLRGYEANREKMRAAQTGASLSLGPSQAEQKQAQQARTLQQQAATQGQAQAAQAQTAQAPVPAPAAPTGPQGTETPYPAQSGPQQTPDVTEATQNQPPAAPGYGPGTAANP